MARAGVALLAVLLVACGAAEAPAPIVLQPLHRTPGADRLAHYRRVLARIGPDGRAPPFRFLGRELTPLGATALAARLAAWGLLAENPGAARAFAFLIEAEPGPATPTLDLGLALATLGEALDSRSSLTRASRAAVWRSAGRIARELVSRQEPSGLFGGPVETAVALHALRPARVDGKTRERLGLGTEWVEPAARGVAGLAADPPEDPVARVHVAAACVLAGHDNACSPRSAEGQATQRRLLEGVPVEGGVDLEVSLAFLWLVLGPDSDPDHPLRPACDRFRARYEAGEVRARDLAEEVALVLTIEWFGYDAFGAAMGYLPCGDLWAPAPAR